MLHRIVSRAVKTLRPGSQESLCLAARCSFATSTNAHLVTKIDKNVNNRFLNVTWENGITSRYPFVYLRDICQCSECYHNTSKQRAFDSVAGLTTDLVANEAKVEMDGKQITLIWPNNHISTFDSDWLFARRLPEEQEMQQEKMVRWGDVT